MRPLLASLAVLLSACVSTGNLEPEATDEELARINLKLGVEYLRQQKPDIALQRLNKVLELQPDNADAHSVIALTYTQLDDTDSADKHYRKAMELTPENTANHGKILNNYAVFLCNNQLYAEADRYFQTAINTRHYRSRYAALENAGACAEQKGDAEKAETYYRKALQIQPQLPRSLLGMARLQIKKEGYLKTRAFIQRFHEHHGPNPESLWLAVKAERGLGNEATANKLARKLLIKFPESDEAAQVQQ